MNMQAPVRAIVADDEELLRDYLVSKLKALWPELNIIGTAANGIEAAKLIERERPDVAFLDIKMPGATGLEVAQGIEGDTRVVFVTAYDEYAVEAFEREAVDYLVKPVNEARLAKTCERLKKELAAAEPAPQIAQVLKQLMQQGRAAGEFANNGPLKWIRASAGATTHHVPVAEVLYFQSDEKYTIVKTADAEHVIRTTLGELAAQLDPDQFWQIHRSSIVNLNYVASTRRDENARLFVRIKGTDTELPVSRAYVHLFKQM
jgi:DNA-binding LytR/AlgR family response regulator